MASASAKLASSPDEAADVTAERDVTWDVTSEGDVPSGSTFAEVDGSTSRSASLLICQKSIRMSVLPNVNSCERSGQVWRGSYSFREAFGGHVPPGGSIYQFWL